ncbi:hypothetical protein ENUP19_0038G0061 [Entamoeba nuttalli]|uniref:Maelstrom domain-containing protein n=2 Tax=Entamoeba nuttalli TaxID=412467 RepID=K2HTL5_ENTNP|nr:hypothetical protein ENU1_126410 [Entamoeba nuttalli P19]EKE39480.1 hypothetical protein ENU1_126410 [Entamoeba nuttalli P19]|eukprot:XP_008858185.1 hypothetical protein ENU1_126410 [Entamoeba nuttalli P19]
MSRADALFQILNGLGPRVEQQLFFILDFQISYKTDICTVPVEICIKPTLLNGTVNIECFQTIINQPIPIQHFLNSKHYTDFEHGISQENNPVPQTDFDFLWKKINSFIKSNMSKYSDSSMLPIVICTPFISSVQCVEFLASQAKVSDLRRSVFNTMFSVDDFVECVNRFKEIIPNTNAIYNFYKPLVCWTCNNDFKCDFHKSNGTRTFCCSKTNSEYLASTLCDLYKTIKSKIFVASIPPQVQSMVPQQQLYY